MPRNSTFYVTTSKNKYICHTINAIKLNNNNSQKISIFVTLSIFVTKKVYLSSKNKYICHTINAMKLNNNNSQHDNR